MVLSWLAQEGPHATKHHGWSHPISVLVVHYSVVIVVMFVVHDWLVSSTDALQSWSMSHACQSYRSNVGLFLALYNVWFLPWRLYFCNPITPRVSIVYEYTWLCNASLVLGRYSQFAWRGCSMIFCQL